MKFGDFDTRLAATQLQSLFGIEHIFQRRGRSVRACEPSDRLLFQLDGDGFNAEVFEAMHSTSFRKVVSTTANATEPLSANQIHDQHIDLVPAKIQHNLETAVRLGMLTVTNNDEYQSSKQTDFGASLEWYVAALFTHELSSVSYWGVEIENLPNDYDVVVIRETQIGYIECKSGRIRNISDQDIKNFLEREQTLAPQFSVFVVDGVSLERLVPLANRVKTAIPNQLFESSNSIAPIEPSIETFRRFLRIIPHNIFIVESSDERLENAFKEIYEFLTVVRDRPMYFENSAAKARFR